MASLYKYAWKHTKRDQIWMLVVVALSIPALFFSLNLPKLIVNGPIQGQGFERGMSTQTYLGISLPDWLPLGGGLSLFDGFTLDRLMALYVLSGLFLLMVIVNGWFKYYLNTYKGRLGERMLRRMRFEFVDLVLRFPILRFRQLRSPEVASMIKDELEPIGGFIGEAFVTPVYLISQVLTAIVFIFVQSVQLGMVAMAVMVIQIVLIPRMRRRLLVLGRQRQLTARMFAGRVGEIVEGIASVHTNDTSNYERAGVAEELGRIYLIRFDIYQWKFLVKFLNNFLSQVTPFIFYLFGGYFAIRGQLDIGQLVAVIAAYKDLPSPLKDLIDWDQSRLDVTVKYEQVVEQFDVDNIADAALQKPVMERIPALASGFALTSVGAKDDSDGRLFEQVTLDLPLGERVAVVSGIGEGAEHVAEVLGRLRPADVGQIILAGEALDKLPEAVTGRRVAYVDASPYFPRATLRDTLLYSLRHYPVKQGPRGKNAEEAKIRHETKRSGNTLLDVRDDWIDYEALGLASPEELGHRLAEILKLVILDRDVHLFGLRTRVPAEFQEEVAATVLQSRHAFRDLLAAEDMEAYVEPFDSDRYIANASIMENIVFGAPVDQRLGLSQFYVHPFARDTLRATGLSSDLFEIGRNIAATMIELFGELEPGNPLLQRISVMTPEELGDYRQVLSRAAGRTYEQAGDAERAALVRLALSYIEPSHRLGIIDDAFRQRVVETRRIFREKIPEELAGMLVFHDADAFNPAASIQDNILFGRIAYDLANATAAVEGLLLRTFDELGLSDIVQAAGLYYDVGAGAKRLSVGQQQKLALARALMKAPDYLIVNRGLSALDADSQSRIIEATLAYGKRAEAPFGTFWVLASAQHAELFDRAIEFKAGRVVADAPIEGKVPAFVEEVEEIEEAEAGQASNGSAGPQAGKTRPEMAGSPTEDEAEVPGETPLPPPPEAGSAATVR